MYNVTVHFTNGAHHKLKIENTFHNNLKVLEDYFLTRHCIEKISWRKVGFSGGKSNAK